LCLDGPVRPLFAFAGTTFVADSAGALWWPEEEMLVVADLHLEKGSALARCHGRHLPPYDSRATIERLAAVIDRRRPRRIVCLGDSFHDRDGGAGLDPADSGALAALMRGRDWVWIEGNHDPAPPAGFGGSFAAAVVLGTVTLQHEPDSGPPGQIVGHLHPKAAVATRAGRIAARCFAWDESRLILPAFGAYAGGLDVLDPAIASWFAGDFQVALIGRRGLFRFERRHLRPIAPPQPASAGA
jgi:DNA ligase-associated metallophosphoesterase